MWAALTEPNETRKYFFERGQIDSAFETGASLRYVNADSPEQQTLVHGQIVRARPGHELTYTFSLSAPGEKPSQVSWQIDGFGHNYVKLTLTHQGFDSDSPTYQKMKNTWSSLLCRLQTLLENGGHGWQ